MDWWLLQLSVFLTVTRNLKNRTKSYFREFFRYCFTITAEILACILANFRSIRLSPRGFTATLTMSGRNSDQ